MNTLEKFRQGTAPWFKMVGELMCEIASRSRLPTELNLSLVERYTDGVELREGVVQGLRFDIQGGTPTFRVGARYEERADIEIEITAAAARTLNTLLSADPDYAAALEGFLCTGEMRVLGDPSRLGSWLSEVHDRIVDRTI